LQVTGSLPDSAWERGGSNYGSWCRAILKSREVLGEECAANVTNRIYRAAAENTTLQAQ